jgi:hypothetical protein
MRCPVSELESRLLELGQQIAYPPTPNLAARVRQGIEREASLQKPGWLTRLRVRPGVVGAAAVIAVGLAILLASPSARNTVAGWLGLRGVIIQRVPHVPSPTPSVSAEDPLSQRLGLGSRSSLAAAESVVGFKVLVPASLGAPDAVYLSNTYPVQVTLVYVPRPGLPESGQTGVGLLMTETSGGINQAYFEKMLGPDTQLKPVTVKGNPGVWISGTPHGLIYADPSGEPRFDTLRLAGNTLAWQAGQQLLRIEANVSEAQALAIANSAG